MSLRKLSPNSKTNRSQRSSLRFESLERREVMAGDAWPVMDNIVPTSAVNGLSDNHFVLAGDFDGNGHSDIAYIHKATGGNRVVLNQGNGRFVTRDNMINPGAINGMYDNNFVLAGDFDRNGYTDLVFIHKQSGGNRTVLNQGNGRFTVRDGMLPTGAINGMYDNHIVLAGDFDGNRYADVVFIHKGHGENRTILNQGNGQFQVRDGMLPKGSINGMLDNNIAIAGDFDGNRYTDVVFIHKERGENRMVLNQGNGNLTIRDGMLPVGSINHLYNSNYAIAGDFDRSGDAELLFINKNSGGNRMLGTMFTDIWFGPNAAPWHRNDGVLTITGTSGNDQIVITNTDYGTRVDMNGGWGGVRRGYTTSILVNAGAGDDYVRNDTGITSEMHGGEGNDELDGGGERDRLFGGDGNDLIFGRNGHDILDGGRGNDDVYGGEGADMMEGGAGADILVGGGGSDYMQNIGSRHYLSSRSATGGVSGNPDDVLLDIDDTIAFTIPINDSIILPSGERYLTTEQWIATFESQARGGNKISPFVQQLVRQAAFRMCGSVKVPGDNWHEYTACIYANNASAITVTVGKYANGSIGLTGASYGTGGTLCVNGIAGTFEISHDPVKNESQGWVGGGVCNYMGNITMQFGLVQQNTNIFQNIWNFFTGGNTSGSSSNTGGSSSGGGGTNTSGGGINTTTY